MKLRILENGWDSYTGPIGSVEFVNGVSVTDVGAVDVARIGASLRVESLEGVPQGPAQQMLDTWSDQAALTAPMTHGDEETSAPAPEAKTAKTPQFTREELEEIADKGGLSALRVIGSQHGVRGRGIVDLIGDILKAQDEA